MQTVKSYLSLIKFSHTIFAMPFALIGFFLGWKQKIRESGVSQGDVSSFWLSNNDALLSPLWRILLLVVLCMIFARSAAMAFNRYLDRSIDAKNPRTAIREIPTGTISAQNALIFTFVSSLLFIATCYFINPICFYLAPVIIPDPVSGDIAR